MILTAHDSSQRRLFESESAAMVEVEADYIAAIQGEQFVYWRVPVPGSFTAGCTMAVTVTKLLSVHELTLSQTTVLRSQRRQ